LRKRWIAFLDRLRPDDEYYREEEGRAEKTAMLAVSHEELVDEKSEKTYEALNEVVIDEKMDEMEEEQEEGVMSMSMSQEIASFQDVADMVSEMVAAKEG
jgi:hypothetical protein